MSMTLEQVIADCEEEISDCQIDLDGIQELLGEYPERKAALAHDIDDYKKRMDFNRQLAEWLRELQERRKQPEAPCYLGSPCEYQNPDAEIREERTKKRTETHACDLIGRQVAIDAVDAIGHIATMPDGDKCIRRSAVKYTLSMLPPAQPEYEPVTAEDFAKTTSETSVYSYMLWHSEALTLMKRQGFVICKKAI